MMLCILGNSWGTDPDTGESGMGLGAQEQFYGCADIAINSKDGSNTHPTPGPPEEGHPSNEGSVPAGTLMFILFLTIFQVMDFIH